MSNFFNKQGELGSSDIVQMSEHFFGYGRWDAPFWFVGPEAGMGKDGSDNLAARYESWKRLEFSPVVDCAAHHLGFGFTKWHQPDPPIQRTWGQLIRLLLTYKGLSSDKEAIRKYQRERWGSLEGETCVIELSGLASPNMQTRRDRATFLSRRIERIRKEALRYAPEFIVMYGEGQRKEWERIADSKFDSNGLCWMNKTIIAVAPHPTAPRPAAKGLVKEYWMNLGRSLRSTVNPPNQAFNS